MRLLHRLACLLPLVPLLLPNLALANAGVFTGDGHTLSLSGDERVQMVREAIVITPGRGPALFDGGVAGMDRVEYDCRFTFKNLTDKPVEIHTGFPLNADTFNYPSGEPRLTSDLVADYRFIAQEEGRIYNVTYQPGDRKKKLRDIFTWTMPFAPNEEKVLRVTYTMPISMGIASTAKKTVSAPSDKQWYEFFSTALEESFGYVTETGRGWAGVIERAEFTVRAGPFEAYLFPRPFIERTDSREAKAQVAKGLPTQPTPYRHLWPDDWQPGKSGDFTLAWENTEPPHNLRFRYFLLFFPRDNEDLTRLITALEKEQRRPLAAEDLTDMRDILLEYNGTPTGNPRIKAFVKNQLWHGQKIQNPVPSLVIEALNARLSSSPATP
jgi:hypothetical protein